MDMSIEQFRTWAASAQFSSATELCNATCDEAHDGYDDDGSPTTKTITCAWAYHTLTAQLPDGSTFEVGYPLNVQWAGTTRARYDEEFTAEEGEGLDPISVSGLRLIDEDGDVMGVRDTDEVMREVFGERLTSFDVAALLPPVDVEEINEEGEVMEGMEQITLSNPGAPDVRFTGKLVAKVSSSPDLASSYYSGSTGRYTVLRLFRTRGGKFIAESTGVTQWQGERDRIKVKVCETEAEVIEFFGHGWLAKDLYEEAGISDVNEVD